MSRVLLCLSLLACPALKSAAYAQAPKPEQPQVEIDRLISQLASDLFGDREAASRRRQKIGPPAVDALRAAASDNKDAEVRRRAANVLAVIEDSPEQLLIDYRALGLPMPPQDAKLVRYEAGGGGLVNGKVQPPSYGLAFL